MNFGNAQECGNINDRGNVGGPDANANANVNANRERGGIGDQSVSDDKTFNNRFLKRIKTHLRKRKREKV